MAEHDTNSTPEGANVDKLDGIAAALLGEEQTDEALDQDVDGVEELTEALTGESEEVESYDVEQETDETEAEEEEEPEEEEAEPEAEESDVTWAGVLGVDDSKIELDENGDFAGVKVKVDGEESTINMDTLIAGYQNSRHNANTSKSLADDRREFESVRDQTVTVYTQKLEDVAKLTEHLHSQLTREFQNVDWQTLRNTDPAEYAAMTQDFQARQAEIQNIYAAIDQERQQQKGEQDAKFQEAYKANLQTQMQKLVADNPEWKEPEKMKQAFIEMNDFANNTYGFTEEEFNRVADARIFNLLRDAMAYRRGLEKATAKTVKRVPKVQKPAKRAAKPVSKLDKLTRAAQRANSGTERRDLQTSAIAELIAS